MGAFCRNVVSVGWANKAGICLQGVSGGVTAPRGFGGLYGFGIPVFCPCLLFIQCLFLFLAVLLFLCSFPVLSWLVGLFPIFSFLYRSWEMRVRSHSNLAFFPAGWKHLKCSVFRCPCDCSHNWLAS